ncbi:MAG: 16S rRNA (cytosine(967)-C(5))-methyltransferase RsmB, partial [Actinomycetota bacterium]|nr:16S rRNA (cytosine(967)-C(5))-methyltransferase RsmB [Actinomycetota bacterium]
AKTTHMAAMMAGEGELVAVEKHPGRARALAETCRQLGAGQVQALPLDARAFTDPRPFDRVLVDPPCSGLGTLQSRPDLRWQPGRGALAELIRLQDQLLRVGAGQLRPGGTLVYSVCTISRGESEEVIDRFLAAPGHEDFRSEGRWQLLPSLEHTDGFFIARLSRSVRAR